MDEIETLLNKLNRYGWKGWSQNGIEEVLEPLGEIGDARAVLPLVRETFNGQFFNQWQRAAKDALEKIRPRLIVEKVNFVCGDCFLRYKMQSFIVKLEKLTFDTISYNACPKCQMDNHYLAGIETVVLLLDHHFEEAYVRNGENEETLIVNWFKRKELFDYDEIRIIDADDYEAEKLVMKLRNDMDDERRERLPEIPVYISPHLELSLSLSKMNLLKDNFKKITEYLP